MPVSVHIVQPCQVITVPGKMLPPDPICASKPFVLEDGIVQIRDVVANDFQAMRNDWRALKHASEELRGDREIVLEAVKHNAWALLRSEVNNSQ